MRKCALSELSVGETVYIKYPNGEHGTATIEKIEDRKVTFRSNWGASVWKCYMVINDDYTNDILKIRSDWDAEVNV